MKQFIGGVTYEYVDLDLPSGLKWAKCNVGAETETDYGDYFMWGDIEDKSDSDCSWESYKYCNGSYDTLTKYNTDSSYGTVDNKTTLEPEDDAARANMGSDWRMPTNAEIQELIDKTTNEWINDYNGTGVNGMKFTASNGNSIFIPASGYRYDSSFTNQGSGGCLWSSSLAFAYNVYYWDLRSNDAECSDTRCLGFAVRGVRK